MMMSDLRRDYFVTRLIETAAPSRPRSPPRSAP